MLTRPCKIDHVDTDMFVRLGKMTMEMSHMPKGSHKRAMGVIWSAGPCVVSRLVDEGDCNSL